LPTMFPLPAKHGIPIGQLWKPTVGAVKFLASVKSMAASAPDRTRAAVMWMEDSPALNAWLQAVSAAPAKFAVCFATRADIVDALTPGPTAPALSSDTLEPWSWMENGVARRLHRDAILARFRPPALKTFQQWESLSFDSIQQSKVQRFFGPTNIASMSALWLLRPPRLSVLEWKVWPHLFFDR
jgi:hypothetical protein